MKTKLFLILILLSINVFSYEQKQGLNYDVGIGYQIAGVEGYRLGERITGAAAGVYLSAGYHYKFSDNFYIEPVARLNLNTANTVSGQNSITFQTIDMLSVSTPYSLLLRIGGLKINRYGFELILGLESTNYTISDDFATFAGGTKSDKSTTSNLVYGLRVLGFGGSTAVFDNVSYGFEILTQTTSINPIQNVSESWDVTINTLSVFYLF